MRPRTKIELQNPSESVLSKGQAPPVKHTSEFIEGPEAWTRFNAVMKKVIAAPHAEIKKRIEKERRSASKNPNRRGPKKDQTSGRASG